ncbi:arylsulfatase [Rugosimonospora africana]|uniref:Arylsulfatase n=1 Tax=Rugosimonospora africana TaxID=556532 RepID=A0A8J3R354_9ACTN|nr:arylsulfatase [Rugosimonospora africana]GIH20510.1 arylsulfatase [Rugosimonospora africana]
MNSPNILLICVDQWRGDCLSIDGHPVVRTPYLDRLASRGARFRHAYSATPTCIPARTALMTGLSQQTHHRVGYLDGVPFEHQVTLPAVLRGAGYQTQAIGKLHVYPERARIGFDNVILHDGYLHQARRRSRPFEEIDDYLPWLRSRATESTVADYADHGIGCNSVPARPWPRAEALHPTNWTVTEAISWLYRRDPTAPFFLYLSFHRPHPPYDPPSWAFETYLDTPPYRPVVGDWWQEYAEHRDDHNPEALVARMDQRTLHRARAGYYGHMTHIDQQINRFLEALAEFGLAKDTYLAFVSDHGEMLGEHNLFRKGFPYEGSARIPFLLHGPASSGIAAGTVRDEVVELRDVMPTLLDCAGVPVPDGVEGRSVLPLARGGDGVLQLPRGGDRGDGGEWRRWLHGEHTLLGQSLQFVTDGRTKYVWLSGTGHEQLFDLDGDPGETVNLAGAPAHAGTLETWRARLIDALSGRPEGYVRDGALVPGREPVLSIA